MPADPPLTAAGHERAAARSPPCTMPGWADPVTPYRRNRDTAAPIASQRGITRRSLPPMATPRRIGNGRDATRRQRHRPGGGPRQHRQSHHRRRGRLVLPDLCGDRYAQVFVLTGLGATPPPATLAVRRSRPAGGEGLPQEQGGVPARRGALPPGGVRFRRHAGGPLAWFLANVNRAAERYGFRPLPMDRLDEYRASRRASWCARLGRLWKLPQVASGHTGRHGGRPRRHPPLRRRAGSAARAAHSRRAQRHRPTVATISPACWASRRGCPGRPLAAARRLFGKRTLLRPGGAHCRCGPPRCCAWATSCATSRRRGRWAWRPSASPRALPRPPPWLRAAASRY